MRQSVMVFSNAAARTAAITSPVEGMLTWLEDVNRYQSWNGSAWVSPDDLTLIVSQTIGTAVSSVTVSNAFSATYNAYKVIVSGGVGSTASNLTFKLGSASSGHQQILIYGTYTNTSITSAALSNGANFPNLGNLDTNSMFANIEVTNPFLSQITYVTGSYSDNGVSGAATGRHNSSTSFTDFTIAAGSGTMTGGTINVYGYRKAF
jgi:hypothetical protein